MKLDMRPESGSGSDIITIRVNKPNRWSKLFDIAQIEGKTVKAKRDGPWKTSVHPFIQSKEEFSTLWLHEGDYVVIPDGVSVETVGEDD